MQLKKKPSLLNISLQLLMQLRKKKPSLLNIPFQRVLKVRCLLKKLCFVVYLQNLQTCAAVISPDQR